MRKGLFCEVGIVYTFGPCFRMKQFRCIRRIIGTGEEREISIYTNSYFGLLKLVNHWNKVKNRFKYFVA
jgi:hypothetical protein